MEMLYEKDGDYRHGRLLLAGSLLFVTLLILLPLWIFRYRIDQHILVDIHAPDFVANIPPPRLQTLPRDEALSYREKQQHILTTYAWTDRRLGLVRIPIDEALKRYEISMRYKQP